ncbi:hypothetical protein JCM18750_36150 [Halostagnicola bangensis]
MAVWNLKANRLPLTALFAGFHSRHVDTLIAESLRKPIDALLIFRLPADVINASGTGLPKTQRMVIELFDGAEIRRVTFSFYLLEADRIPVKPKRRFEIGYIECDVTETGQFRRHG